MIKPMPTTVSYYEYYQVRPYLEEKYPSLDWRLFWDEQTEYCRRGEMMSLHAFDIRDDEEGYVDIANAIEAEFGESIRVLFNW